MALLRIAQEALSNVSRHSGATRVDMTLRADGDELALSVRDDGVGFDAAAAAPRDDCFGLESMRERVELAGGTDPKSIALATESLAPLLEARS